VGRRGAVGRASLLASNSWQTGCRMCNGCFSATNWRARPPGVPRFVHRHRNGVAVIALRQVYDVAHLRRRASCSTKPRTAAHHQSHPRRHPRLGGLNRSSGGPESDVADIVVPDTISPSVVRTPDSATT
jgi:hypothetical protein